MKYTPAQRVQLDQFKDLCQEGCDKCIVAIRKQQRWKHIVPCVQAALMLGVAGQEFYAFQYGWAVAHCFMALLVPSMVWIVAERQIRKTREHKMSLAKTKLEIQQALDNDETYYDEKH